MTEVKTYYYTEGNTVRQVAQPLPDRHTREREIREEREKRKRQERRKMQRMMRKKRIYSMYPFDTFICAKTPAGRWGDPEDMVGPCVFLASYASDFVNGQILYADGGILAYSGRQPK